MIGMERPRWRSSSLTSVMLGEARRKARHERGVGGGSGVEHDGGMADDSEPALAAYV